MAILVNPPCIIHEDDHLLVVHKPAGWNTHSPSPFAGEGIYDWLKHREPRWSSLAIIHRLDKGTSGLLVFAKSPLANKSLTAQFTARTVRKEYLFLTHGRASKTEFSIQSHLQRAGEKYISGKVGEPAETSFKRLGAEGQFQLWAAYPKTGRTHQIRAHAAQAGIPILGDPLYGGAVFGRLCLHARSITFSHPESERETTFSIEPAFGAHPAFAIRQAIISPEQTNAFRLLNGAADGTPGLYLEQWADFLLAQSESELPAIPRVEGAAPRAIYHKLLNRQVRKTALQDAAPSLVEGEKAPPRFTILENGIRYEASFEEGYSVGLFLDQRDNRARLLRGHVAADFPLFTGALTGKTVLNTFAYTCAFSVCAAAAGATCTSLDLSRKYLDWGRRNFELNGLDPQKHDFIYGEVFDWASRLARKGRVFDLIILDPPTFSHAKKGAIFRAEKDYGTLVQTVLPMLNPGGILFASTNARLFSPQDFLAQIRSAAAFAHRRILQQHYVPQPPDFPVSREEPAYLKTVWLRLD